MTSPEDQNVPGSDEMMGLSASQISFSQGLHGFLNDRNLTIACTSYGSGNLYFFGPGTDGQMAVHQAQFPQAMGVAGDANRIYLATDGQVVRLENVLSADQLANNKHDKLYVPRNTQHIGAVDLHEIGVCEDGRVVFVNTKYSCVCAFSLTHSFKPIWSPQFISKIVPEDRCHLNGLGFRDGQPRYVTAACRSDVVDGWRDRRADGGIVVDMVSNDIIAEGLSMPHSPRWHDGRVWVLNSGTGEIGWIDQDSRSFCPLAFCPGFMRGLNFVDGHAVVTLSKPRYDRFDGLQLADTLAQKDADAWCGVQIISLHDGSIAHWIRLDGAVHELFDVTLLAGVRDALTLGPGSADAKTLLTVEN
ncbi:MAG: TIGR03032 family protein [Paracoccaceae bacterium]